MPSLHGVRYLGVESGSGGGKIILIVRLWHILAKTDDKQNDRQASIRIHIKQQWHKNQDSTNC